MLPDLPEVLANVRVVDLPLTVPFRGLTRREACLVEGPEGWAEFAPFVEYDDAESSRWLAAALEYAWSPLPATTRTRIAVNATVPAVPPDEVVSVLARFPGARTAKVKLAGPGETLADAVARVAQVRRVLGPEGRIRVDANAGWNLDEAEHAIHELAVFDLEYVEQPCDSMAELGELRRRIKYLGIGIAVDEGVRKAEDPGGLDLRELADVIVLKAAPLGGITSALRIAERLGLPAVVSSALDTSVGLSMGAYLAAALPTLDYDCGLGTAAFLGADVTEDPLLPIDGSIEVRRVDVSDALTQRYAASAERTDWWRARLSRCHRLLAQAHSPE